MIRGWVNFCLSFDRSLASDSPAYKILVHQSSNPNYISRYFHKSLSFKDLVHSQRLYYSSFLLKGKKNTLVPNTRWKFFFFPRSNGFFTAIPPLSDGHASCSTVVYPYVMSLMCRTRRQVIAIQIANKRGKTARSTISSSILPVILYSWYNVHGRGRSNKPVLWTGRLPWFVKTKERR